MPPHPISSQVTPQCLHIFFFQGKKPHTQQKEKLISVQTEKTEELKYIQEAGIGHDDLHVDRILKMSRWSEVGYIKTSDITMKKINSWQDPNKYKCLCLRKAH